MVVVPMAFGERVVRCIIESIVRSTTACKCLAGLNSWHYSVMRVEYLP